MRILTEGTPGDFSVSPGVLPVLSGGSSATIGITFSPGGSGIRNALLEITAVEIAGSPFYLRLTGSEASPLDLWRLAEFGTAINSGQAADTADPDGDGISNLLEFATATPPRSRSVPGWQARSQDGQWMFTYARPAGASQALIYELQQSSDPGNDWHTLGEGELMASAEGVEWRRLIVDPGDSRIFLRLRIRVRR